MKINSKEARYCVPSQLKLLSSLLVLISSNYMFTKSPLFK